jgi:signal transduction histidine kinase
MATDAGRAGPQGPADGRPDHLLVRTVQRLPFGVGPKLLVALLGGVILLVATGILGLRAIADSTDRADQLREIQQRAAAYRALQTAVEEVRFLIALRAGGPDLLTYLGATPGDAPSSESRAYLDEAIATTITTRLGPGGELAGLGFTPPASEQALIDQIAADETKLSDVVTRMRRLDLAAQAAAATQLQGAQAEPLVHDLEGVTDRLVGSTSSATDALIADDRSALAAAQRTFIAVAAVSILLALGVGYALSRSVVGPIQRMEARLAAIAAGDFGGRVQVPNRDELGSLAANINRMNDELGRLYAELESASRHKSEFLANMSHELRTPLNAIIGFSEILGQEMAGPLNESQRQYVEDVLGAGQHLLSLINDILDLSKVEAGRMDLALGDVSIADALEQGVTLHQARASRNAIDLDLRVEPDVGLVRADERKVRQVIFNLVSNAVKFTPSGGRVEVSARRHDGVVEIAVADTGVGIPAADQERIFEEFQQGRAGAGGAVEGTGLGLTLSRRFVELHGGRLWVESEPGSGTTFRFTLPAEAAA